MTCADITPLLSASIDDELSAVAARGVHEHVAGCAACATRLRRLHALRDALRAAAPGRSAIDPRRHRASLLPPAVTAAALGAAMLMLLMGLAARRDMTMTVPAPHEVVFMEVEIEPACYRADDCGIDWIPSMP